MRKSKINILSIFLILAFSLPIFIQSLHDIFEHDYSHDFYQQSDNSFQKYENEICVIHSFKYFSYNLIKIEALQSKEGPLFSIFSSFEHYFIKENIVSFYLLRGPPILI